MVGGLVCLQFRKSDILSICVQTWYNWINSVDILFTSIRGITNVNFYMYILIELITVCNP